MVMASDSFQRALALISVDQFFEAMPLLDALIAQEPAHVEAYVARARVRRRLQDAEGAIADYTKAIRIAPKAATYLARSLVWLGLNNLNAAIADSREAIALDPNLAGAYRLLGKALGQSGDGLGAIMAYKQAARCYLESKDKANAKACLDTIGQLQADLLTSQQTANAAPDPARSAVREAAKGAGATTAAFVQQLQMKYEQGEYAAVLKELDWLLNCDPKLIEALCLRALVQAQLGRREQAVADLATAKQLQPAAAEVRFCRGQMRLILKDGYGAIEEFSALIGATEPAAAPSLMAKCFAQRAQSYEQVGDLENAFKDFSNAIAIETENAKLYELRAKMQAQMGAGDGAIADYQQAATLWLNEGNWKKHQQVVEAVRSLRKSRSADKVKSATGSATVPIKAYNNHMPVVEVLFDGIATFDLVIDRNATHSIVTRQMANRLNLETVSYRYVYLADGTPMELSIGRLRSVGIGPVIITDVFVAIAPDNATAVLGKDCFSAYSVRISGNEITFLRRGG
jgi:tetratricopeptide (TPR) repeat protein